MPQMVKSVDLSMVSKIYLVEKSSLVPHKILIAGGQIINPHAISKTQKVLAYPNTSWMVAPLILGQRSQHSITP